jgi:hypothetical protein
MATMMLPPAAEPLLLLLLLLLEPLQLVRTSGLPGHTALTAGASGRDADNPECTEMAMKVWWTSEGHRPNTTVLAIGGSLCYIDTVNVCDGDADKINGPPYMNAENCTVATILNTSESSLQFLMSPSDDGGMPRRRIFQVCNPYAAGGQPCSPYYTLNAPSLWWAQGDGSANGTAVATPGGWLRLYGRSLGWTADGHCAASTVDNFSPAASTSAVLVPKQAGASSLPLTVAMSSCYHTTLSLPASVPAGEYTLSLSTSLATAATLANVTIVESRPWPSKMISVAVGANVSAALAQANAVVGGATVLLAAGMRPKLVSSPPPHTHTRFILKMIILPRQARDRHGETPKQGGFLRDPRDGRR